MSNLFARLSALLFFLTIAGSAGGIALIALPQSTKDALGLASFGHTEGASNEAQSDWTQLAQSGSAQQDPQTVPGKASANEDPDEEAKEDAPAASAAPEQDPKLVAAKEAVDSALQGDYLKARLAAARSEIPVTRILVEWLTAQTNSNSYADRRRQAFLDQNPNWPARSIIKARMAAPKPPKDPRALVAFRQDNRAQKNKDWLTYVEALKSLGQEDQALEVLRTMWRSRTFYRQDEADFIAAYGDILTYADHIARMEWLLDNNHKVSGKRHLPRLSEDDLPYYRARFAIMSGQEPDEKDLKKISKQRLLHPDFSLADVARLERKGHISKALEAFLPIDAKGHAPEELMDLRMKLTRALIYQGRFEEAYALASAHRLTSGKQASEAEVLAGWLALRQLEKPEASVPHFERAMAWDFGFLHSKAAFWLAQAQAKLKNDAQREQALKACAARSIDLYAQLCTEILGQELKGSFAPYKPDPSKLADQEMAEAARLLSAIGQHRYARLLMRALIVSTDDLSLKKNAMAYARQLGYPRFSYQMADEEIAKQNPVWDYARPLVDLDLTKLDSANDRAFFSALLYQESRYQPDLVSHAGAMGVAQLLPGTAEDMARRLGLEFSKERLLSDPQYNAELGWRYVLWLREVVGNRSLYVMAGYNAGHANVRAWKEKLGEAGPGMLGTLDWIERIPFSETRSYVERIYANVVPYRNLLARKAQPADLRKFISQ